MIISQSFLTRRSMSMKPAARNISPISSSWMMMSSGELGINSGTTSCMHRPTALQMKLPLPSSLAQPLSSQYFYQFTVPFTDLTTVYVKISRMYRIMHDRRKSPATTVNEQQLPP